MSLLPRTHSEFQAKEYWDSFFSKRSKAFEWYGEYTDLCHILHKYLKPSSRVLVVGCGNSKLSEELYDAGFQTIDNIDISDIVIRQMLAKNKQKRPGMTFTKMDILHMMYTDAQFDCVLDKGTLDAIFSNTDDKTVQSVDQMFAEIERVLKIAGRYLCISLVQDHILKKLLEKFEVGWLVRVHKVLLGDDESGSGMGGALPVFVFILTKMARVEGRAPMKVYEHVDEAGNCVRCERIQGISEFVRNHQQYAMVKHHLNSLHVGEDPVQMDLWSSSVSSEPRYTLSVVDLHKRKGKNGPFAIFIVPQGRETEWLFSSDPGRRQLAESAGFERLVVVTLHRGHAYSSLDAVKEEVAGKAVEFVQQGLPHGKQHPVLTLGDGLGSRVVLHEGSSVHSGGYVVEECDGGEGGEGVRLRRLVFLSTQHLAQTEVHMVPAKTSKTSKKSKKKQTAHTAVLTPDHTYLTFGHHKAIIAALALLPQLQVTGAPCDQSEPAEGVGRAFQREARAGTVGDGISAEMKLLVVGLGGGALPMFINKCIPNCFIDVVELDEEMLMVAEKWFGFHRGERLTVHIADGVRFISECVSAKKHGLYDAIILDVDSKDVSTGVSSPPRAFVDKQFLTDTRLLLKESGLFLTNVASRNKELRTEALYSISCIYPQLFSIPIPEDINELVVGLPTGTNDSASLSVTHEFDTVEVKSALANLAAVISKNSSGNIEVESVLKEWTNLFSSSRLIHEHILSQ